METRLKKIANYINHVDAHHKLYVSVGIAASSYIASYGIHDNIIRYMLSWLVYVLVTLTLAWVTILSSHPTDVKYEAHAQDSSRTVIFFFVIAAAFTSLFAVGLLLNQKFSQLIFIPLACVIGSWWLVHTVFTLRYAHLYYCDMNHHTEKNKKPGGLIFPEEKEPDYLDFTYFSFVIGMTFQVSDVQVTSRTIRRLAWMHGVLSFAFNTFIVALTINIIAGLTQK